MTRRAAESVGAARLDHEMNLITARANANAPIGERMAMVTTLTQQRRQAEQDAIRAGFDAYIDPVTQSPRRVIK